MPSRLPLCMPSRHPYSTSDTLLMRCDVCANEPVAPNNKNLTTASITRTLEGKSQGDLLAILELLETLIRCRDWDGLTELFSDR